MLYTGGRSICRRIASCWSRKKMQQRAAKRPRLDSKISVSVCQISEHDSCICAMFSLQRQEKATEDSWGGHCQCPVLGTCEICSSQVQVINSSNSREDTKGPRAVCLLSELGVPSALVDWIVPWMVACAESLGSSVKQRPIKIAASGQQVTDQRQAESKQATRQIAGVQVEDEETFLPEV